MSRTICHICKIDMDDHSEKEEKVCLNIFVKRERFKLHSKHFKTKHGNYPT